MLELIKIFALHDELLPTTGTAYSAGIDLRANLDPREEFFILNPGESRTIGSGLFVEIPQGWCGMCIPRSGLGSKGLHILNSTGLIDSDYRGEIRLGLVNNGKEPISIGRFDRVVQMVILPHYPTDAIEVVSSVDELSKTNRDSGGFGSTGTK